MVGVFTPGLALTTAALLHVSLAHTGPVVAHLKILVACFIKAFLCESYRAPTAPVQVPSPRQAPPIPGWTQQLLSQPPRMAPLLGLQGPLTCATVLACEGRQASAVVGHMVMGAGTCAPIEAGPRGTRVKDS